jgi:hypothetical protein
MTDKVELEGKLFVLVEEDRENDDVSICAEISGIDIWKWLKEHSEQNVRITLEEGERKNGVG